jgi:dTMP kinase
METKGKFIVIEGIDGCGGETQTKFLSDFLSQKGYEVKLKSYPGYEGPIGQIIDKFLHKKYDFPIDTETLIYFADFTKDTEDMEKYLKSGIIISDRYFTSTIVYQYLKGFPLDKMLKLSEMFKLPKPDLCIYIKISAETSFNRKMQEKGGNLDRHEEDKKFLKTVAEEYEKIAKDNIFCDWTIIDGEKSIEEVSKEILEVINKKLGI